MYYIYVIKSEKNGKHYIGYTEDLAKRLISHNSGKVRSTKAHRPYKVIYKEEYINKTEARKREIFLKSGQGREELKNKFSMGSPPKAGPP